MVTLNSRLAGVGWMPYIAKRKSKRDALVIIIIISYYIDYFRETLSKGVYEIIIIIIILHFIFHLNITRRFACLCCLKQ